MITSQFLPFPIPAGETFTISSSPGNVSYAAQDLVIIEQAEYDDLTRWNLDLLDAVENAGAVSENTEPAFLAIGDFELCGDEAVANFMYEHSDRVADLVLTPAPLHVPLEDGDTDSKYSTFLNVAWTVLGYVGFFAIGVGCLTLAQKFGLIR